MSSFGVKLLGAKGCYWPMPIDHRRSLLARERVDQVTKKKGTHRQDDGYAGDKP